MLHPWNKLDSQAVADCKVFKVRQDTSQSPQTGEKHTFYVIEAAEWINVIPITSDQQVALIRQYRHGVGRMTLEIPGGMVDDDDPSPLYAARRELVEETGYNADQLIPIGVVDPNPAILNNQCHTFLALNAVRVGEQQLDVLEEINVELVPLSDIPGLIAAGQITHALTIAALYFFEQYQKQR